MPPGRRTLWSSPVRSLTWQLRGTGRDNHRLHWMAALKEDQIRPHRRNQKGRNSSEKISFPPRQLRRHPPLMGTRREARERTVQFLFQHDLNPPDDLDEALRLFWESQRPAALALEKGKATWGERVELPPPSTEEAALRLFAEPLIRGVVENRKRIDEEIVKYAKNWDLHRMAVVDRNILRLAIYEMLFREDIPPVVSINEGVEIAKKYSTQDSGKFVNGILDRVKAELMRPAR
jgi:N utilization substance protein B